jgi:hypothetical protein
MQLVVLRCPCVQQQVLRELQNCTSSTLGSFSVPPIVCYQGAIDGLSHEMATQQSSGLGNGRERKRGWKREWSGVEVRWESGSRVPGSLGPAVSAPASAFSIGWGGVPPGPGLLRPGFLWCGRVGAETDTHGRGAAGWTR